MRNLVNLLMVVGALTSVLPGCAAAPRQRPVKMGSVDTGSGSLEATRRQMEGRWTLASLEVVDASGKHRPVKATGQLTYDAFSNLTISGVIQEPALQDSLAIDFTGRVVLDPAKKQYYPVDLNTQRPVSTSAIEPVAPDKIRQYDIVGDTLTVTYLDAAGKPTALAVWKRAQI